MDLSIIIVSYNTKDFLIKCIESIIHTAKNVSFEIIVVDNASSDATVSEISKLRSQSLNLKIVENKENQGFSKANNQGVNIAKGEYLLFLNPDTIIYENTLDKMFEFMEKNNKVGASTCKVMLPNGKIDDACHRGFPTPWSAFSHFSFISRALPKNKVFGGYKLSYLDTETTHEIDACAGAFMLVRRSAGDDVKWWDEDYFWYGEDLDFCYRLKKKGWKVYYVSDVSILHYKGVSGGIKSVSKHLTTADKKTKEMATKARFEAMRVFYRKHYQNKYPFFINWLTLQGINLKNIYSSKFS